MQRLVLAAVALAALAACDSGDPDAVEATAAPAVPRVQATAADGYVEIGGRVNDIALLPNSQPFLSRGLAALEGGGFAVIDFAEGATRRIGGEEAAFLAAAPDFQLRGSPAPLVIAAGGALAEPQASVFLVLEDELVAMPMDPIAPEGELRAMCAERATEALLDLLVFTDSALERWRITDRGGDRLAAQHVDTTPMEDATVSCAGFNGEVLTVTAAGRAQVAGRGDWALMDGSDVAAVERSDGWWAIVARPGSGASLIAPRSEEIAVSFNEGLNTPSTPAPTQLIASSANFGGSFGDGLLVIAQDDTVAVVELGGFIDDAKEALNGGS